MFNKIIDVRTGIFLILCILVMYITISPGAYAEMSNDGDHCMAGQNHYAQDNYELVIMSFEQAVLNGPDNSDYHYWLARSYGKHAEFNASSHTGEK